MRWGASLGTAFIAAAITQQAQAQTWVAPRTTPRLNQIVALDATGETGWPYGAEDLAGDGLGKFTAAEQETDFRTAYAATDAKLFWVRGYVSDTTAVGAKVELYVFIDADRNPMTGGRAGSPAAMQIDPAFTDDPTNGGYEYVISVGGDGQLGQLWTWSQAMMKFNGAAIKKQQGKAEKGHDADPIAIGASVRGYVQAAVDLNLIGLTEACDADFFFRSVNSGTTGGKGDLVIGRNPPDGPLAHCKPDDANDDGVPDMVVPPECKTNKDCPAHGLCIEDMCVIAEPCKTDADCVDPNPHCDAEGFCVPDPGGACMTNADCMGADAGLVCVDKKCVACTSDKQCGRGETCAPDGRCVDNGNEGGGGAGGAGVGGAGGEGATRFPRKGDVRGGACKCSVPGDSEGPSLLALLAPLCFVVRRARRRRESV